MGCKPCRLKAICSLDIRSGEAQYKLGLYSVSVTEGKFYYLEVVLRRPEGNILVKAVF
jgi:hypothetical protein